MRYKFLFEFIEIESECLVLFLQIFGEIVYDIVDSLDADHSSDFLIYALFELYPLFPFFVFYFTDRTLYKFYYFFFIFLFGFIRIFLLNMLRRFPISISLLFSLSLQNSINLLLRSVVLQMIQNEIETVAHSLIAVFKQADFILSLKVRCSESRLLESAVGLFALIDPLSTLFFKLDHSALDVLLQVGYLLLDFELVNKQFILHIFFDDFFALFGYDFGNGFQFLNCLKIAISIVPRLL